MPKINKIPTLEFIRNNRDDFNIKGGLNIIKVIDNSWSSGVWYGDHVGELFVTDFDFYKSEYKAIACLTKFVKPSDWNYRLSGWFYQKDIEIVDENYLERHLKLKRLLNV